MKRVAAFLDFQGTLGGEGLDDIRSFEFYPFSVEAIKKLNENGILTIGITNQSHIAKGKLTQKDYEEKLQKLKKGLAESGAQFDAVYCCPHSEKDNCVCKKPNAGMIETAEKDFEIDIKNSFVVGDMGNTDMLLAKNVGAKAILVLTGVGKGSMNEFRYTWQDMEPEFIAENVLEAVNYILANSKNNL